MKTPTWPLITRSFNTSARMVNSITRPSPASMSASRLAPCVRAKTSNDAVPGPTPSRRRPREHRGVDRLAVHHRTPADGPVRLRRLRRLPDIHEQLPLPLTEQVTPLFELDGQTPWSGNGQDALFGVTGLNIQFKSLGKMQPGVELGYQFPIDQVLCRAVALGRRHGIPGWNS